MTSPYTLSPPTQLHEENSSISLRELVEQEARHEQQQQLHRQHCRGDSTEEDASNYGQYNNMLRNPDMASSAGPSNRRIHLISYSSDSMSALASQPSFNSVTSMRDMDRPSSRSSSRSADSEYSLVEDDATPVESLPPAPLRDISGTRQSRGSNRPRGMMDTEGSLNVLLDPSFEEWAHQRIWDTPTPISPPIVSPQEWRTPTQTEQRDRDFKSSSGGWSSPYDLDRTPRNSMPAPSPTRASPSRTDKSSSKIPGGRLLFVAPPDVSRRSLDELQRDIHGLGLDSRSGRGTRVGLSVNNSAPLSDEPEAPHSAPVNKTTFGNIDMDLKVAKGRTRPMSLLPPSTTPLDSPRSSSRNASPIRSPGLTPQPPPKSELRRA
jgi:hypothetical protein